MNRQNQMILNHLKSRGQITPLEALNKYGCFRLAARIFDLKAAGNNIGKIMIDVGQDRRVASYYLIGETK